MSVKFEEVVARKGLGSWDEHVRFFMSTKNEEDTMATKLCISCGIRRQDRSLFSGCELCAPCNEEAEWENTHSDYNHGPGADQEMPHDCWICFPELNKAKAPARKGHTNTKAHTHTSHADHNHPRTPKARAACRASMASGNGPLDITKK